MFLLKKKIVVGAIVVGFVFVGVANYASTVNAVAKPDKNMEGRFGLVETLGKVNEGGTENKLPGGGAETVPVTAGKIIGAGLSFIGVLFLVLTIYGGIYWMTARGNEQQATKAKDIIVMAVAGIIVVLGSYAIVKIVLVATSKTAIKNSDSPICSEVSDSECSGVAPGSDCDLSDDTQGTCFYIETPNICACQ